MSNALTLKKSASTTTSMTTEVKRSKEPPPGAKILSKTVNTSTEQIENGFLISKNYDIRYQPKGSTNNEYTYYSKKWYTKDDPLTITVNDKSLADEFDDE